MNPLATLAPAFAISIATQQAVEVVDPFLSLFSKWLEKKSNGAFDSTDIKRSLLGLIVLAPGSIAYSCNVLVLDAIVRSVGLDAGGLPIRTEGFLEWFVTCLVIGAGSDAFNSIMKFINAVKEERKGAADESLETASGKSLENKAFELATFNRIGGNRPIGNTCHILAIGDSIVWGQGLNEDAKFTTQIARYIETTIGVPAPLHVKARSGATIVNHPADTRRAYAYGELPSSRPTIMDQARSFTDIPAADVALVIMDGGINDIDAAWLMFADENDLISRVFDYCYVEMTKLLLLVANKYRNADIVVTGYYKIISKESHNVPLELLKTATCFSFKASPEALRVSLLGEGIVNLLTGQGGQIVKNCSTFATAANKQLSRAVDAVNMQLRAANDSNRIIFVDPGFGDGNAVCTGDQSFLWHLDPSTNAMDPARAERIREREHEGIADVSMEGIFADRASTFHPNEKGAQRYYERIKAQLGPRLIARKGAGPVGEITYV